MGAGGGGVVAGGVGGVAGVVEVIGGLPGVVRGAVGVVGGLAIGLAAEVLVGLVGRGVLLRFRTHASRRL